MKKAETCSLNVPLFTAAMHIYSKYIYVLGIIILVVISPHGSTTFQRRKFKRGRERFNLKCGKITRNKCLRKIKIIASRCFIQPHAGFDCAF